MTAVNGVTWTEEDIWQPGLKKQGGVYAIEMTSYDNPMNSSEIIDEIKSHCFDAVEIAIRIYGKRQARGGLVLKTFSVKDMIEPFELPESCDLIVAIDPHPVTPHAVLFAWVDYDGLYHSIIDEKPNIYFVSGFFKTGHIPGLVSLIREREKLLGRSHDICLCDPSAWNENQKDRYEKSVADQLLEEDLVPLKGSKDLSGGILKMNEMFAVEMSYDGEQTKTREHPQAFIFQDEFVLQPRRDDSIQRLKWEFLNWRWPNPNQNMNMGNRIRRPIDRDDHMAECARRICEFVYDSRVEPLPMDPDWMTKKVRLGNGAVVDFSNAVTNELEVGL
jgi:hypothetical protein